MERVEERVTSLVKGGKSLLDALSQERSLESELVEAEKQGDMDRIFQIQKQEIKLALEALQDIRNVQIEILELSDDERRQLDDFIIDAKRLLLEGVPEQKEKDFITRLKKQKQEISQVFKKARMRAG